MKKNKKIENPPLKLFGNAFSGGFSSLSSKEMAKINAGVITNRPCSNQLVCEGAFNSLCDNSGICRATNTSCSNLINCSGINSSCSNGPVQQ